MPMVMIDFPYGFHMPTLYVENVPKDLYEGLRARAKEKRRSMAAELIAILEEQMPSEEALKKRRQAYERLIRNRPLMSLGTNPMPSAEELIREDRER